MLDQKIYMDDIYTSKKCDSSSFKAVVMMSKEARFINNQAYQGFIQLEEKPTTIAMNKFKQNKLSVAATEEK
jgi:DNA-directed RNA polymerase subunit K/omega